MSSAHARHAARGSLAVRVAAPAGLFLTAVACLATLLAGAAPDPIPLPEPAAAMVIPRVQIDESVVADPCAEGAVVAALDADDDSATVLAFGGGDAFREAVVTGNAPCISLDDPNRNWVVVNKLRPLQPESFAPTSLSRIELSSTTSSNRLRGEPKDALQRMAADAKAEGAGKIGINNGYRSYHVQQRTYSTHLSERGRSGADAVSARPGFSEHQSGLAFDLVACSPKCGSHEAFGDTVQSRWVTDNAWRYGFIVRYEHGETGTTGYLPEPWHIRYIGPELAQAYHEGGFHTLEEFFGLPPAPDYEH